MMLLAVLFHNIQFVLFHLLAEVLPEAFFVVYFVNTEDFFNFKTKS